MIDINELFEKITENQVYEFYLKDKNENIDFYNLKQIKSIRSPFSTDENASFSIYQKGGKLLWKLHSDSGKGGSVVQLVMDLKSLDFKDALKLIVQDLNVIIDQKPKKERIVPNLKPSEFTKEGLNWWLEYKVTTKHLEEKKVSECIQKNGAFGFLFYHGKHFYRDGSDRFKLYIPKQKLSEKQFPFNKLNGGDIIGYDTLPVEKIDRLFILAGEKDRIVLYANTGDEGVNFLSETTRITKEQYGRLKDKAKNIYIAYDNDATGQKAMEEIVEEYPEIKPIYFPGHVNDTADFFKGGYVKLDWENLVKEADENYRIKNDISIVVENSSYYRLEKGGKQREICNFIIESPYFIQKEEISERQIKIISATRETEFFNANTDDFVSVQKFSQMVERKGNYFFNGKPDDLAEIKKMVLMRSEIIRSVAIKGFDKNTCSFVFENGVLTKDLQFKEPNDHGVLRIANETIHIDKDDAAENKLIFNPVKKDVVEWFEKLRAAYGDQKAFYGFTHTLGSVFFRQILEKTKFFPLLFCYGRPQSGKTIFGDKLKKVFFPEAIQQTSLTNSTTNSLSAILSQFSNCLIHFDEYKNNLVHTPDIDERLKNAFDGIGRNKSTKENNNRTYTDKVSSGLLITGEHLPKNEALFTRSLLLEFAINDNNNTREQFKELCEYDGNGLSAVLMQVFKMKDEFDSNFSEIYEASKMEVRTLFLKNDLMLSERQSNNHALYLSVFRLLELEYDFGNFNGKLNDIILSTALRQNQLYEHSNPVAEFWNIFATYNNDKISEGYHYKITSGMLAIPQKTIDLICTIASHNKTILPDKATLLEYLKKEDYYVDRGRTKNRCSFRINHSDKSESVQRASFFNLDNLNQKYEIMIDELKSEKPVQLDAFLVSKLSTANSNS